MNKKQWYACGTVFSLGVVMSFFSQIKFASMPVEPIDVTWVVYSGLHIVLGKACILGVLICFLCGLFEKEGTRRSG